MIKSDFGLFSKEETRELDDTFYCEEIPVRRRYIFLGALITVAITVALLIWGASPTALAATFLAYVLLSSLEKLSYVRSQRLSRVVMQKLVRRIEQLEGVPATRDNGPPFRSSRAGA
jgi:hypothetical protein